MPLVLPLIAENEFLKFFTNFRKKINEPEYAQ